MFVFHQKDTLKRFFERFEQNGLTVNRFRADCGSCSEEIVKKIEKHCKAFYIRANRCSSLYNDILPKMADSSSRNQPKFLFLEACMHMHTRVPEL